MQICAYSSTAWPISWNFQHQRPNAFNSPAVFHCQNVTDHSPCLPHLVLPNAGSKSSSRTDEIRHCDCHVKFENNTSGHARLWDSALKFLCPGLFMTSPDHLEWTDYYFEVANQSDCLNTNILVFSKIQLVVYHQCCGPIGWATSRLYVIAH